MVCPWRGEIVLTERYAGLGRPMLRLLLARNHAF
jgi:hypothetical protein